MDSEQSPYFRLARDAFRWDGVAHQPYKPDGEAPFKDISRQTLFHDDALACELRYFEMDPGEMSVTVDERSLTLALPLPMHFTRA